MQAKKSLGQHFLHNVHTLDTIVDAGNISADDIILEIGPGHGALTKKLLSFAGKVVAVEKDIELVQELEETFRKEIQKERLELIEGDILDFDMDIFSHNYSDFTYKVIANIPYNITGAILKHILSAETLPKTLVILIQREVAERILAKKKESILSLSVKAYGTPRIVAKVGKGSFTPPPTVDSAILSIEKISKSVFAKYKLPPSWFFEVVRAGFAHKRKILIRNLETLPLDSKALKETWMKLHLDINTRAEDLSLETWFQIAKALRPL